jgi:DMSO/TMAO reductase YedYZ molybdopterin-dependent catalytic subunit
VPAVPSPPPGSPVAAIAAVMVRVDDALKALANRAEVGPARERIAVLLDDARARLPEVDDEAVRLELAGQLARRAGDLDRAALAGSLGPSPGVSRAPTRGIDPARVPPGQHLTAGWPVLHVGRAPADPDPATWTVTVTGQVRVRTVLTVEELRRTLPTVREVSDLHCVTGWSRLGNAFTGVRLPDLLDLAGVRETATHLVASGPPAYSVNLDLEAVRAPVTRFGSAEVLVAWAHDDQPLDVAHGGPVRLVVPARYGWKSVKWLTELRLLDHDVRGYWEERGYHDVGDPYAEQRYRDLT